MSLLIGAAALSYSGMLGLCLGTERQFKQLRKTPAPRPLRLALRLGGVLGLALALYCCMRVLGGPMGAVAWAGGISAGGLLVALLFSLYPRSAVVLGAAALLVALGVTVVYLAA